MTTTAGTTSRGYRYPGDASATDVPGDLKKLADDVNTDVAAVAADGAVTTAKIAASAVTSAKIADATIVAGDLADGAVTSAKILDGTIATADLADGAVTSAKIADGTIATGDLADSAVTSAKIADGTIVDADVSASAAISPTKIAENRITFSNEDAVVAASTAHLSQIGTMSAARTVTLPAANAVPAGWELVVSDDSGTVTSTNKITLARAGSDTINGGTSEDILTAYGWRRLLSDGASKWTFDGGLLRAGRNLADVGSAATALSNLGGVASSLVDAKGDLIAATADNTVARKAVGADGAQLMADSTASDGLLWARMRPACPVGSYWATGTWSTTQDGPAVQSRQYYWPIIVPNAMTVSDVYIYVFSAAASGALWRLAFYSLNATGSAPGSLIADCGTVDPTGTGIKVWSGLTLPLPQGLVWGAITLQGSGAGGGAMGGASGAFTMVNTSSGAYLSGADKLYTNSVSDTPPSTATITNVGGMGTSYLLPHLELKRSA